jgi:hypothetical protein
MDVEHNTKCSRTSDFDSDSDSSCDDEHNYCITTAVSNKKRSVYPLSLLPSIGRVFPTVATLLFTLAALTGKRTQTTRKQQHPSFSYALPISIACNAGDGPGILRDQTRHKNTPALNPHARPFRMQYDSHSIPPTPATEPTMKSDAQHIITSTPYAPSTRMNMRHNDGGDPRPPCKWAEPTPKRKPRLKSRAT